MRNSDHGATASETTACGVQTRPSQDMPHGRHPQLAVRIRSIESLLPDASNARLHTPKHVQQLAKSISAFGFNVPILVDASGQVVAGHGRLLAVKQLGWSDVPTITLEHLTPKQLLAFRLADNRLNELSTWDETLLGQQLKGLAESELDFDLEAIGFDMPEIDLRIQSFSEIGDEPVAEMLEGDSNSPVVSASGDVWQLGRHRIVCGNALEQSSYDALLGSQQVDMVFTDPPYNVKIKNISGNGRIQHAEFAMGSGEMSREAFTAFLSQSLALAKHACTSGALIYACMDWRHLVELSAAGEAQGFELKNIAVWDKGCGGLGSLYRSQHELVFVFKTGNAPHTNNVQLGRFGRNRSNIWNYPGVNSFARETGEGNLLALHPTCKPVALVADTILDASQRGDIVLDPFLGSGTTIIAAEKTGRVGYGIELDPGYVDTAVRRWQRLTGLQASHAVTGTPFDVVATERAEVCIAPIAAVVEEGA